MAPLLLVVLLLGASAVSAQLTPCSVSESSSRGTIVTSLGSQLSTLAGSSPFNATLSPVDDAGAPVLFSLSSDSSYTLTLTSDVLNARLVSLYTLTVLFWVSTASAATPLSLNVSVTDVEAPPMFAFSSLGLNVSTSASGVSFGPALLYTVSDPSAVSFGASLPPWTTITLSAYVNCGLVSEVEIGLPSSGGVGGLAFDPSLGQFSLVSTLTSTLTSACVVASSSVSGLNATLTVTIQAQSPGSASFAVFPTVLSFDLLGPAMGTYAMNVHSTSPWRATGPSWVSFSTSGAASAAGTVLTVSVGNGAPFTSSSPCATSAVTITVNNGSLPAVSVPFTACAHYGILSITYASLQSTVGTSIDMPTQPSVGASSAFQISNTGFGPMWFVLPVQSRTVQPWLPGAVGTFTGSLRQYLNPGQSATLYANGNGTVLNVYTSTTAFLSTSYSSPQVTFAWTLRITYAMVFPTDGAGTLAPKQFDIVSINVLNMGVEGFQLLVKYGYQVGRTGNDTWITPDTYQAIVAGGSMRQLQVKFAYSDPTLLPGFTYVGRIYIAIALQTNASHIVDLREIDISLTTLVGDPDYTMSFLYMESVTGAVDSTFQQMLFGGPVLGLPANYGYQDRANAVLTSSADQAMRVLIVLRDPFGNQVTPPSRDAENNGGVGLFSVDFEPSTQIAFAPSAFTRTYIQIPLDINIIPAYKRPLFSPTAPVFGAYLYELALNTSFSAFPINDPNLVMTVRRGGSYYNFGGTPLGFNITAPQCQPNEVISLSDPLSCTCGPGFYRNPNPNATNPATNIGNTTRLPCLPCSAGTAKPSASDSSSDCIICEATKWSLAGWSNCTNCLYPNGCVNGRIRLPQGSWFSENTNADGVPTVPSLSPDSLLFTCPTPTSCNLTVVPNVSYTGNFLDLPAEELYVDCIGGSFGPLCSACLPGYSGQNGNCSKCTSPAASWTITAIGSLLLVALVAFLVKRSAQKRSKFMSVVRIMLNWLQALGVIASFRLNANKLVGRVLSFGSASDGINLNFSPIQCAFRFNFYDKFLFTMALPFIAALIAAFLLFVWYIRKLRKIRQAIAEAPARKLGKDGRSLSIVLNANPMTSRLEAKRGLHLPAAPEPKSKVASPLPAATATGEGTLDEVVVERAPLTVDTLPKRVIELFSMAMVVILFMLHNLLAKTSLSVFSVYPTLINGHRHLQSDMTVSSADALFGPLVAGAVLSTLIYGFGIPSVAVFILIRRRNQLETDNQFKFLYDGYDQRRGRYLWEAVVLTRKVAVIAVAALIDDPFNQAFAGLCLMLLAWSLHILYRPYESKAMNMLEEASLGSLLITEISALLYWRYDDAALSRFGEQPRDLTWLTAIVLGVNLLMAIVFFTLILAFLHAPLMVWLSGATKRLLTRKKKKVKGQRRTAAKSGMPVPKDAEEDEEDEDKEDVHSGSDEDEQGLKFADTYENDEAWGKKGDAPVPAAFTSLNPLAKLAVQDPTNKAARRAAASGAPVDEATQMTSRVSAWASKLVLRSQDALAELSAQEAAAKPQALSALPASGKDEPPRPPASSLLVSRAYAGKGAAKH